MPGSTWELRCPSCSGFYEITTGGTSVPEPDGNLRSTHYEQVICRSCKELYSVAVSGDERDPASCPSCAGPYEAWPGIAGFPEGARSEVVAGPCPRCGTELDAFHSSLWD
jgi:hypothetical protein